MLRSAGMLAVIGLIIAPLSGSALTTSGNITVTAAVAKKCVVSITQPSSSLTYDPFTNVTGTPLNDSTGAVVLNCTRGTSATIDLNHGLNGVVISGSIYQARMVDGAASPLAASGDYLNYNIYQNSGHTTLWGTTSGDGTLTGVATSADVGTGPGVGNQFTHTLYLSIPGGQNPAVATFTDTMVATATY